MEEFKEWYQIHSLGSPQLNWSVRLKLIDFFFNNIIIVTQKKERSIYNIALFNRSQRGKSIPLQVIFIKDKPKLFFFESFQRMSKNNVVQKFKHKPIFLWNNMQ